MKGKVGTIILGLGMAFFVLTGAGCDKTKIRICIPSKDDTCKCKEWGSGDACDQKCECEKDNCEK